MFVKQGGRPLWTFKDIKHHESIVIYKQNNVDNMIKVPYA